MPLHIPVLTCRGTNHSPLPKAQSKLPLQIPTLLSYLRSKFKPLQCCSTPFPKPNQIPRYQFQHIGSSVPINPLPPSQQTRPSQEPRMQSKHTPIPQGPRVNISKLKKGSAYSILPHQATAINNYCCNGSDKSLPHIGG